MRFTMPYAPIAKSPPVRNSPWLITITIKQDTAFIKKGESPIESESTTIFFWSLEAFLCRWMKLFLLLNNFNCHISMIVWEITVAQALPFIPHWNTKINRGLSTRLITTVAMVAYIAFSGLPDDRSIPFSPKNKWVITFPSKITSMKSRA